MRPTPTRRKLEAFATPELVAELAPHFEGREPREAVRSATVAGIARIDNEHALVTVAATLDGPTARRLVTVPIARDARGGLVVDDLPSFASAPARAAADTPDVEPLLGPERAAIVDVLTPFMRAYLAGDSAALTYLVPPGDADRRRRGAVGADRSDLRQPRPGRRLAPVGWCWWRSGPRRAVAGDVCAALPRPAGQAGSLVRGGAQRPGEGDG